jgi:hypothetical protein
MDQKQTANQGQSPQSVQTTHFYVFKCRKKGKTPRRVGDPARGRAA